MAEEDGEKGAIEQQLERAVCARLQHFKDQADSLTLESVRRLLEKDLGFEKFALDAHKRFIRQYLEKKMEGAEDGNSKTSTENVVQDDHASKEEANISHKELETKADPKKATSGDDEIMEDSPIMGVLTPKSEVGTQGSSLSESKIEEAIWARAGHFRANTEELTLAGVRRLLEEDLGLEKNYLDSFKTFISRKIDQVLSSPKETKSAKKKASDNIKSKKSKKASSEEESYPSNSESDEMEDKVKSRKETTPRRDRKKMEQPRKRKISEKADYDDSGKKHINRVKKQKHEHNNSDEDGSISEDGRSQSSGEKTAQKKEKSATGYGKRVENLKSIIKACGMSVAPSVYRKAKQVPDDKREAFIVKELEDILSREGLSKNPTEKEIKDCRKRKDTARELEGIDMSNIISSSRRRSTFSFVAPEKPAKKDKIDVKASKKIDNNDRDHNDDNEEKEKEEKEVKEEDEQDKKKEEDEQDKKEDEEEDKEEEEVEEEVEDEDDEEEEDDEDESEDFNEDDNEDSD